MAPSCDNIRDKLRQAGLVATRQRVVIYASLAGRTDHPDAERMLTSVRGRCPRIALDTVYRALNQFADLGLIQHLALPTRRWRFDGNTRPHDHFLCTSCERIIDVTVQSGATDHEIHPMADIGKITGIQRVYTGLCRDCR